MFAGLSCGSPGWPFIKVELGHNESAQPVYQRRALELNHPMGPCSPGRGPSLAAGAISWSVFDTWRGARSPGRRRRTTRSAQTPRSPAMQTTPLPNDTDRIHRGAASPTTRGATGQRGWPQLRRRTSQSASAVGAGLAQTARGRMTGRASVLRCSATRGEPFGRLANRSIRRRHEGQGFAQDQPQGTGVRVCIVDRRRT